MSNRVLFTAPHPDDEVMGCGGTIKKYSAKGYETFVLIVSRGSAKYYSEERIKNVRNEARDAHRILGVKETFFMDYNAPELDIVPVSTLASSIAGVLKNLKINILFLPHRGDIHMDHTAVFNAGIVAARPVAEYTVNEILSYETLSETEWAPPFADDAFIPNHFEDISLFFDEKKKAMECFKSQVREFPNPRSTEAMEALAKFRGSTVGFERAEAFMQIRRIVSE